MSAAVMLTIVSAAGAAAGSIPRPPGAVDNRGWELVSLADKNQSRVMDGGLLSSDGNRATYAPFSGVARSQTGARPPFIAQRTAGGWRSTLMLPPRPEMIGRTYVLASATPDLSSWIASAQDSSGSLDYSPDVSLARLDGRLDPQGLLERFDQSPLHTFPVYFGANGVDTVASTALTHVFSNVPEQIDASHQADTNNVYDFGSGRPVLVSVMEATEQAPTCGVQGGGIGFAAAVSQNWISTDGSKAFFQSRGDDGPACGALPQLYRRDLRDNRTALISGPPLVGDPDQGVNLFVQATPDGSQVFYRTGTSLDPADDTDGDATDMDIYRWNADGNTCMTCVVPAAAALAGNNRAAVSKDGSHVYFASAARLADAPAAAANGSPNIYVVRDGTINYITRTIGSGVSNLPNTGGQLTPDGSVLIFRSSRPELDALSGASNGGFAQFYRYDDRAGSITCLSCPPAGTATADVPTALAVNNQAVKADVRVVTDDGRTVFFPAADALVPEDVNQTVDLYEWHDGTARLITSGRAQYDQSSLPVFFGATSNGHDVLFIDTAKLTAEAQDETYKLYDARIDGGFPSPPTAPAPCQDDACHGTPSPPPLLTDVGSELLMGAGNASDESVKLSLGAVTRAARASFARTGKLSLHVNVDGPAELVARARAQIGRRTRTVAQATKSASDAASVRLVLRLSPVARAQLDARGRLRVVVTVGLSGSTGGKRLVLSLKTASGR